MRPLMNILSEGADCTLARARGRAWAEPGKNILLPWAPAAAKRSPATSCPLSAALASSPSSFPALGSGSLREQNPHLLILRLTTFRYRKFAPWQFIILSGKPTCKQRTGRGAPQGRRDCHLAVSPPPPSLCPHRDPLWISGPFCSSS